MLAEQSKLQFQIDFCHQEIEDVHKQLERDEAVIIKIANQKKKQVESRGEDRLKINMYNTDGTACEVYSFHDLASGSAANYENITKAFTELASQSEAFRKTLKNLKNKSTYSNLNLDYAKIGKGFQKKNRQH